MDREEFDGHVHDDVVPGQQPQEADGSNEEKAVSPNKVRDCLQALEVPLGSKGNLPAMSSLPT